MEANPNLEQLMKFLSAGALPTEPDLRSDQNPNSDADEYLNLGEAVEMLLEYYAKSSRAEFSKAEQKMEVPESEMESYLLAVLGTGFSLPYKPDRTDETPASDISSLVFVESDFPAMQAGALTFKMGNKMPKIPELMTTEDLIGLDRHRPFCNLLLEMQTEFTDFFGETNFPFILRDIKYVFATPTDAQEYFRRGWRSLSENHVPLAQESDDVTMTDLYRWQLHEEIENDIPLGDAVRMFRTRKGAKITLNKYGVDPHDQIIVVVIVRNVITKLYLSSRDEDIPLTEVTKLAAQAASRMTAFCNAVDVADVVQKLPGPLSAFRQNLLGAWQRLMERCIQRWYEIICVPQAREPCCVCGNSWEKNKRCAGCRQYVYCGKDCQKNHWKSGHRKLCSLEYVTMKAQGKESSCD